MARNALSALARAMALPLGFGASLLAAGSLEGTVRLVEKDGRFRMPPQDMVALLEPLDGARTAVGIQAPLRIRTVGKRFVPRVAITTPGSEVAFPNQDHILHNVFSVTPGNLFDTGTYEPGDSPKVRVRQTGLVKLYCNVHHQMNAFLWVVDTPWASVLDGSGNLRFANLPAGRYRLRLWHPEAGEQSWTVQIGTGVTRGEWALEANRPALEVHKNKFGKDYPPERDDRSY